MHLYLIGRQDQPMLGDILVSCLVKPWSEALRTLPTDCGIVNDNHTMACKCNEYFFIFHRVVLYYDAP